MADHYATLGVAADADADELRSAYRRLIREHHPDRRAQDPASVEATVRLNAAWAVLGDAEARAAYDRLQSPRTASAAHRRGAVPGATRVPIRAAYSEQQLAVKAAFSAASVRAATLIVALGVVLLLVFSSGG